MINKWKKEEETFGADASREKVTCYLGGNSKRGLFFHWEIWAQNDIGGGYTGFYSRLNFWARGWSLQLKRIIVGE